MQVATDTRELLKRMGNRSMIKISTALFRRLAEAAVVPDDCTDELLTTAKRWLELKLDKGRVIVLRKQLESLLQAVGSAAAQKPNTK